MSSTNTAVVSQMTVLMPVFAALIAGIAALVSVWYQRRQERLATNRAILAEISRLIGVIRKHHQWWLRCMTANDVRVSLIPFTTAVYDKLTDKLGTIHPDYIGVVVNFYGFIHYLNAVQKTRRKGHEEEFATFYAEELGKVVEAFPPLFTAAFDHFGIPLPEEQPILNVPHVEGKG